jgi:hypothetical protein
VIIGFLEIFEERFLKDTNENLMDTPSVSQQRATELLMGADDAPRLLNSIPSKT